MAPAPENSAKIEEARRIGKTDPVKAEAIYKEILSQKPGGGEASLREYESALMGLGESYRDTRKTNELAELVQSSTSSLSSFTKAKTAKLGTLHSSASSAPSLTLDSPPAFRSFHFNTKHCRGTDFGNQVMHRMGCV